MNDDLEPQTASRPERASNAPLQSPDSRIQGGSIRLFRVAGIDVLLHWSWFFFAFLRLQSSDTDSSFGLAHYDSQVWFLVEYLGLFGIVLLHEFGHVLACRSVGGIANRIILWPLGGIAFVDPPPRPGALLWSIAAGPLVNVLLLAPTIGFWMVGRAAGWEETAPDLFRFAGSLAWINGYLLLFNILPVYPLDGGKMLQALLWFVLGRARSLLVAAGIGLLTGLALLVFAIVDRSLVWGVMAALGLFFSLVGFQGARALSRMLAAPRREEAACPACAPPRHGVTSGPACAAMQHLMPSRPRANVRVAARPWERFSVPIVAEAGRTANGTARSFHRMRWCGLATQPRWPQTQALRRRRVLLSPQRWLNGRCGA